MYFGSVRFFKHLIVGVTALMIIIPVAISVVLGIENGNKDKEISELRHKIVMNGGGVLTADELLQLYKDSDDKEAFLELLSEYDEEMYASFAVDAVPTLSEGDNTIPAGTFTGKVETDVTEPEESKPETEPFQTTAGNAASPDAPVYQKLYPELRCDTTADIVFNADMDYLYFTFDDGPSKYTESILSYLDKYSIKATFFVVPSGSSDSNALLKKIAAAGHTIGVHSASHEYKKIYASVEAYLEDFKTAYDRIYEATGVKCELFRFPGGSINDFNADTRDAIIEEMNRRGFIYFDWNVDSGDAAGATWTEMYTGVLDQIKDKNRAVILMHDHNNGYNTVLVLEDIIKALKSDKRGFKFDSLTKNVKPIQF